MDILIRSSLHFCGEKKMWVAMREDAVNQLCCFLRRVRLEWLPQLCSGEQEKVQRTALSYGAVPSTSLIFSFNQLGIYSSSSFSFYQVGCIFLGLDNVDLYGLTPAWVNYYSSHLCCGSEWERILREADLSILSPVLNQCDATDIMAALFSLPHNLDKLLISMVLYRRYISVH